MLPTVSKKRAQKRTVGTVSRHIFVHTRLRLYISWLRTRNIVGRESITGDLDLVLSMTTYGPRTRLVYLTIESIVRRGPKPARFILWIDERDVLEHPPRALRRLIKRGLEIRESENFGPHKKLYPIARLLGGNASVPIVTCDDDVLYPAGWLQTLYAAYLSHPNCVSGFRARTMQFDGENITPYVTWPHCITDEPSYRHVLTNVSGCVYPPEFVNEVEAAGTRFMELAPTADDLWLHHLALRTSFPIRQSTAKHLELIVTPGSQAVSLQNVNVERGQNDAVVARLYDEQDIEKLKAEST